MSPSGAIENFPCVTYFPSLQFYIELRESYCKKFLKALLLVQCKTTKTYNILNTNIDSI